MKTNFLKDMDIIYDYVSYKVNFYPHLNVFIGVYDSDVGFQFIKEIKSRIINNIEFANKSTIRLKNGCQIRSFIIRDYALKGMTCNILIVNEKALKENKEFIKGIYPTLSEQCKVIYY